MIYLEELKHGLIELVGDKETRKEFPLTFQEAWHHKDPEKKILWRDEIRK